MNPLTGERGEVDGERVEQPVVGLGAEEGGVGRVRVQLGQLYRAGVVGEDDPGLQVRVTLRVVTEFVGAAAPRQDGTPLQDSAVRRQVNNSEPLCTEDFCRKEGEERKKDVEAGVKLVQNSENNQIYCLFYCHFLVIPTSFFIIMR